MRVYLVSLIAGSLALAQTCCCAFAESPFGGLAIQQDIKLAPIAMADAESPTGSFTTTKDDGSVEKTAGLAPTSITAASQSTFPGTTTLASTASGSTSYSLVGDDLQLKTASQCNLSLGPDGPPIFYSTTTNASSTVDAMFTIDSLTDANFNIGYDLRVGNSPSIKITLSDLSTNTQLYSVSHNSVMLNVQQSEFLTLNPGSYDLMINSSSGSLYNPQGLTTSDVQADIVATVPLPNMLIPTFLACAIVIFATARSRRIRAST